jgi:hypothetical protein
MTTQDVTFDVEREGDEHNRKVIRVYGNRIEVTHPFYEAGSQLEVDRPVYGYERDMASEIARLRGVLDRIAGYGDEDDEWDAVQRYADVREMAGKAVTPASPVEHGEKP